ncbi:MAG TPA: hypothetical protein VF469_24560 [Kofleriaceae bacterium]
MLVRIPLGGLLSLALLAPNLWWARGPRPPPPVAGVPQHGHRVLGALELTGRISCFGLPFFSSPSIDDLPRALALACTAIALAIYYSGWVRYFRRGRRYRLLYESLWGIPVPLAIAPVICFAAGALVLRSPWLAGTTVALAIGHIGMSLAEARRIGVRSCRMRHERGGSA